MAQLDSIMEAVAKEMNLNLYQCAVVKCKTDIPFHTLESVLAHCTEVHPNATKVAKWKKNLMKAPIEYSTEQFSDQIKEFNRRVEKKMETEIRQKIRLEQEAMAVNVVCTKNMDNEKETKPCVGGTMKRKAVGEDSTPLKPASKIIRMSDNEEMAGDSQGACIPKVPTSPTVPPTPVIIKTNIKKEVGEEKNGTRNTTKEIPVIPLKTTKKEEVVAERETKPMDYIQSKPYKIEPDGLCPMKQISKLLRRD